MYVNSNGLLTTRLVSRFELVITRMVIRFWFMTTILVGSSGWLTTRLDSDWLVLMGYCRHDWDFRVVNHIMSITIYYLPLNLLVVLGFSPSDWVLNLGC